MVPVFLGLAYLNTLLGDQKERVHGPLNFRKKDPITLVSGDPLAGD